MMRSKVVTRILSVAFLIVAIALVSYGLFGLSHFAWYTGQYFDDRLVLFDNGVYPFVLGAVLLIGQLVRLQHRRPIMLLAAGMALVLLVWKRLTLPMALSSQALFPDSALLNELIVIAFVLLILALADRSIERVIRKIIGRTT
jgi:hypothetical protein